MLNKLAKSVEFVTTMYLSTELLAMEGICFSTIIQCFLVAIGVELIIKLSKKIYKFLDVKIDELFDKFK